MFQLSAFQRNAFQIGFTAVPVPVGGGSSARPDGAWRKSYNEAMAKLQDQARLEYLEQQKKDTKLEIDLTQIRLDKIEKRRLRALADITLQNLLLTELQALENLRIEYAELQRRLFFIRDEEETLLVLLLSDPFYA